MSHSHNLQQDMTTIIQYCRQSDFKSAEKKIKSLLKKAPTHPNILSTYGAILLSQKKFSQAEKQCSKAITHAPSFAEPHNNLAAIYRMQKKFSKSITFSKKALSLNPKYVDAYINLGICLKEIEDYKGAIAVYEQALSLCPQNSQLAYNLANIYREVKQYEEAEKLYRAAISYAPNFIPARNNLASLLSETGRSDEALQAYQAIIDTGYQDKLIWQNLFALLEHKTYSKYDAERADLLTKMLQTKGHIRPTSLSRTILSLLSKHHVFQDKTHQNDDINHLLSELSALPLFTHFLTKCLITDPSLEVFLTDLRQKITFSQDTLVPSQPILALIEALAIACQLNEFIFDLSPEEETAIASLQKQPASALSLLTRAMYLPVADINAPSTLLAKAAPTLKTLFVDFAEKQQKCRSEIPSISEITNSVSMDVKNQYEENPYPRWIDTALYPAPRRYHEIALKKSLKLVEAPEKPSVLIAGCGTGQHSISTRTRLQCASLTALDLSHASLSYAKAKSEEFGISDIKYLQGDLLDVAQLKSKFDIIESIGTLHHMENPMSGWQALVNQLKTGGLMFIGLYSKLARQNIAKSREKIAELQLEPTLEGIRHLRKLSFQNTDPVLSSLFESNDFYSTSACRDLIFHVQEHNYTIEMLKETFDKLNLEFLGFELNEYTLNHFLSLNPSTNSLYDLEAWERYETQHPDTFSGMYQFWVQKRSPETEKSHQP